MKVGIKPAHPMEVITREEIEEIHEGALQVLNKTGVRVEDKETLERLAEAGATCNHDKRIAKIPPQLVERCLKKAPSQVTLWARNPSFNVELGKNYSYSTTTSGVLNIFDSTNSKYRRATLEDVEKFSKLIDCLDAVNINEGVVDPQEIPHGIRDICTSKVILENSEKHCKYPVASVNGARALIEMASVIVGGEKQLMERPIISGTAGISPPLTYDRRAMGILKEYVLRGLPVYVGSEPVSGGIAPVTLAGTLVQGCAEALAGVVIVQILNPCTPVMFGSYCNSLDMREGINVMGTPEMALMGVAMAQLARYFKLPSWTYGTATESKFPDMQAAYEQTTTTLLPLLAGYDICAGVGKLSSVLGGSYEVLVIENEMLEMFFRVTRGIEVSPDTLALNEIDQVGPGGNFLSLPHTLKYFKKEHWVPTLSSRESMGHWLEKKTKDIVHRAKEKVDSLLAEHQCKPLDNSVRKELDRIKRTYVEKVTK